MRRERSLLKVGTEKALVLRTGKLIISWVQGAFDLMRRCRPCRYLPDSACGLRLASNQNPSCLSEISFGIRYKGERKAMKNLTFRIVIIAGCLFSTGLNPAMAADTNSQSSLQSQMEQLNSATSTPEKMDTALQRIATETGVPIDRVRALHKNHPKVQAAGILAACVLADETKKTPDSFLKQHDAGKSWSSIAEENNVSADKMSARVERLQQSLNGGK
jgi:hypothetical protein